MNRIEAICPYCKTKLLPEDDVVVCSNCGMPHHKECWIENQGCTTFGCLGSITSLSDAYKAYIPPQENDFEITFEGEIILGNVDCPRCGRLNDAAHSYCSFCGNKLIKK